MRRKGLLRSIVWLTLISLTVVLFAFGTSAVNEGDYYYKVENGEAIITDCKVSVSGAITIPETLGGYPVKAIGDSAFAACTFLTDITVPSCVESIGSYAFLGCSRLQSINIQGAVSIGDYAFRGCTSLENVTLAPTLSTIGEHAFYSCVSLENVYISDLASWCGISFADEYSNPLYYANSLYVNNSLTTDVVIPSGVTKIPEYAFASYSFNLRSIEIPSSVVSIGKNAFDGCHNAIYEVFGVYYVDGWAIDSDTDVEFIWFDDNIAGIADHAFSDCAALTAVDIPAGVKHVGEYAFKYCSSLSEVNFEDGVESIGDYAFYACHNLESLALPDSLKSIGSYAFSGYHKLSKISIPKNVSSIGTRAFNVNGVSRISVANGNEFYRAEGNCLIENETETLILGCNSSVIPDGVQKIAAGAFAYSFLDNLHIPASVSLVENGAFDFAYGLESIVVDLGNAHYASVDNCLIEKESKTLVLGCKNSLVPNDGSVTKIGNNAFLGCLDLMTAEVPSCVTEVGEGAFELCQSLLAIRIFSRDCAIFDSPDTICDSVVIYGYAGSTAEAYARKYSRAFEVISDDHDENTIAGKFGTDRKLSYNLNKKTGLLVISGEGKIPDYKIDSYTPWYAYRALITSVVIEDGITKIGDFVFYGCENLVDASISPSVKFVGDAVFAGCSSLTEITIPANVKNLGIAEVNEEGYELEDYYELFVKNGLLYHLNFAGAEAGTAVVGGEKYHDNTVLASERFAAVNSNYIPYLVYMKGGITNPIRGGTAEINEGGWKFITPYIYSYWYNDDGTLAHKGGSTATFDHFVTEIGLEGVPYYMPNGVCIKSEAARTINGVTKPLYKLMHIAPADATGYYIADGVWGGAHYPSSFGDGYFNVESGDDLFYGDGNVHQRLATGKKYTVNLVMSAVNTTSNSVGLFMGPRYMLSTRNSGVVVGVQTAASALIDANSGYSSVTMSGINATKITNYAFTVDASALSLKQATLGFYGNGISFGSQNVVSPTTEIPNLWQYHMYMSGVSTYAIRVYEKVLTEEEVLQNNFADIALINRLDITKFLRQSDEEKLAVYNAFKGRTASDGKATLQTLLDTCCDVSDKAYGVFTGCDSLEKLTVLSTNCVILNNALGIEDSVLVYGYADSAIEKYAYNNGNIFCDLDENTDENVIVGKFGPDHKFTFTVNKTTGELTVDGNGDLPDYSSADPAPWYAYRSYIKSLTVSEGITGIGSYAFYSNNLLSQMSLPDSLVSISSYAFAQCGALGSIVLPKNVETVDVRAFNSNNLSSINVAAGNIYYKASGNCLISVSDKKLVLGCASSVIPSDDSVSSIGDYAFYGCSGLSTIEIPENITEIGSYSFALCTGLTKVTLPDTVTDINEYAFSDCSMLSELVCLAREIPVLGVGAFIRCDSLEKIRVDLDDVSAYKTANGWSAYADKICAYCTHSYTEEVASEDYLKSEATCSEKAIYYKSCEGCGLSSEGKAGEATFEYGNTIPHTHTESVVAPAYLKEALNGTGTYYKSCAVCGASCEGEATELTFTCIYGDVSGEGAVNGKDIVLIRQYIANYDYTLNASTVDVQIGADANGDGTVSAADVLLLRKFMADYNYDTGVSSFFLGPQNK